MGRGKMEIQDVAVKDWLSEFKSVSTQRTYLSALRRFKRVLSIEDLGEYAESKPNVVADTRKFLANLDGKPSKTVATYVAAIKMFMQDHGVKVPDEDWRKIRRRGFMPKRVKAETRDKKPSKVQMKHILNYADIKCRSIVLFLLSSGARVGETLQLKIEDLDLDADPPSATIKSEYTKGGVGGRVVYFSYEARDAIRDWLKIKDETSKRSGAGTYKDQRVFPWSSSTTRFMWNMACDKARLDARDNNTQRRVFHLHSLRKFFRTKVGLDVDITHALMGHAEYLDDAYLRLEQEGEIAKAYVEAMPNVSVYEVETRDYQELEGRAAVVEQENIELRTRVAKMELDNTDLKRRIQSTEQKLENIEKLIKKALEKP